MVERMEWSLGQEGHDSVKEPVEGVQDQMVFETMEEELEVSCQLAAEVSVSIQSPGRKPLKQVTKAEGCSSARQMKGSVEVVLLESVVLLLEVLVQWLGVVLVVMPSTSPDPTGMESCFLRRC